MGGEREELLGRFEAHAVELTLPEMDLVACVLHAVGASRARFLCDRNHSPPATPDPVVYGEPAKGELVALAGSVCVRVRAFVDYASCRADLRSWRLAGAALRAVGDGAVPPRRGLGRQRAGAGAGARDRGPWRRCRTARHRPFEPCRDPRAGIRRSGQRPPLPPDFAAGFS